MPPSVDVSVLVPVLNEAPYIRATVATMTAQRFDGTLEFLLLDGGSTDGTRPMLRELAAADDRLIVLDNAAGTIPTALNLGLRHARGRFIARMDAHTWYPPDYLAHGVARLERGGADWVAGPAIPSGDGRWSRRVARALTSGLGQGGSRKWRATAQPADEWELDEGVFTGVWRRETLERLGGWNEAFPVGEDSEMAVRVVTGGGTIVCVPEMGARYSPRDSLWQLYRQYWRFGRVRVRMGAMHPDALRPSHVAASGLVLVIAGLALPGVRRPAAVSLCGYLIVVAGASVPVTRDLPVSDRAGVAAALMTMHLGWGSGFVSGCLREGVPWRALRRALRRART